MYKKILLSLLPLWFFVSSAYAEGNFKNLKIQDLPRSPKGVLCFLDLRGNPFMYIGPGDNFRVRILNSNGVGEWVKSGKATLEKTPKNEIWGKWKMNSESFTIIIKGFEYEKKTEDA